MEAHSHTPWTIGIVIFFLIGLGGGAAVGITVGKTQKIPTKIIKQVADAGVNVGDYRVDPKKDSADNIKAMSNMSDYLKITSIAKMDDFLHNVGPYTVLLPSNDDIAKYNKSQFEDLKNNPNQTTSTKLLQTNIIPGVYTTAQLRLLASKNTPIKNLVGEEILPIVKDGKVTMQYVNTGRSVDLVTEDAITANGVIHVTNGLLVP